MKRIEKIKNIILYTLKKMDIKINKIILFGSRATRTFNRESDWDILVVIDKDISPKEKREIWYMVYSAFHKEFPFLSTDIIIKSKQCFEDEKEVVNTIANEAYIEGVGI